ncbi:PAS domain-containing protein [Haloferula sp. BvORR071]|uniref:PAS domain-containing protein n=1 Tax=Haloferula sp. BvORR071 TaxID=1396141 RepID=UPI000695BC06|nr:PAS domain-containing protein [Haloferula sp. BvORR071]
MIQVLPAAIYTCDAAGFVETFNAAAAVLWGREAVPGTDRWCGSCKIFQPDGRPLPLEECPMARTLRGEEFPGGGEIIVERPDGSRRNVMAYPQALRDSSGALIGAVNMLVDITERRQAEQERELASRMPMENPSPVMRLADGRIISFANPVADAVLEIWGVSRGQEAPSEIQQIALATLDAGEPGTFDLSIGGRTHLVRVAPVAADRSVSLYFNDISGLRRAEEALRLTEQRFRTVAMNSPVAIFTKDAAGCYTLANPIACAALGHPEGVEGKTDHDMLPRHLADALRTHDLEVMRDGKAVEWEEWVHDRRFLAAKFPLPGADTDPVGVGGVAVDITERWRMEALLRASEARFRTLANHAPVGIFLSAANGDAVFVNASWCAMSGLSQEQAMGKAWTAALHPEDRERVLGGWDDAVRDHSSSESEFRFLRPDGSICWVQGNALRLLDENEELTGYIGSCVDITERKRTAAELAAITTESERKRRLYEGLLTNTPDFAYVFDRQERFTYINDALLAAWGRTLEESLGKTCLELGYEPWHAAMHGREIAEVIATKAPIRGEVPFDTVNGRRIYDYIFTPVFGADGEVEAVAGTTRDVTERKGTEDRAEFLSELSGKLATLSSESELMDLAVSSLGERLGAHRCCFVECNPEEDFFSVSRNWVSNGATDIAGTYTLHDFGGDEWWRQYVAGNFSVADARTHRLTCDLKEAYERLGVISYAVQPFKAEGLTTAVMALTDNQPRRWTEEELALLENVMARVWPLVLRSRSEAALRESRRQMRMVSDHVPALISYLGRDEVFRFANGRYQEWFGIKPAKLKGMPLKQLLGAETYHQREPYIARVLRGQSVKFEGPSKHRELGWRDLEISYVPDFSAGGRVRGFYVMALDITERKATEKQLERQARRLRLLWESAGVILTADNPDLMLQRVFRKISPMLEVDTFFNFMVDEAGDALHLQSCHGITDEQRADLGRLEFGQAVCGTVAKRRQPMVECSIQDSDNPLVQLVKGFGIRAYACNPLMAGDELLGTLSFASRTRDRFEPDELEFMETISHYVTGAYARLRLVDDLRAADRRKDEFLATLAHELRNPLAPIRTGLEVMKMAGDKPETCERVRATMERQVEQLVTLVNDLLDVSRITRGKLQLRKLPTALDEIVRSAVEASHPLIEEAGHRLSITLPGGPLHVDADPHRLAQVISNLLNNAAKYTEEGGDISLEAVPDGEEVTVRVRDTGIGIPPAMLDRIFDMFTQVEASGGGDYGGLGIGLTLVKSLVELHGGSVRAESSGPGLGSTFSFRLPVLRRAPHHGGETSAALVADGVRRRILVVDDNEAAATTLAMAIELMGHDLRVARNGREGVAEAADFLPELILMDLGMPEMDGWEAARRIRSEAWGQRIVLVALTGWGQDEDRRKTHEAGFDHHLVKPAHPTAIRQLLETALK